MSQYEIFLDNKKNVYSYKPLAKQNNIKNLIIINDKFIQDIFNSRIKLKFIY